MNSIPCVIMRGGTSRGPFLRRRDLPQSQQELSELLLNAMGSGHALQIDGIGGGNSLTSKVAIVECSERDDADIDYLFAQVNVLERHVDFSPNCGNMLSAVGPYAIEAGLVEPEDGVTIVRVFNINTHRLIDCHVPTPGRRVIYEGNTRISGVPGQAAGIRLSFLDIAGSKTGALLPTGQAMEMIDGTEVSCLDAATPVMMVAAHDLGLEGDETPEKMDMDAELLARLEYLRLEAGQRMGLGDVRDSVLPKPVVLSAPRSKEGVLTARYFVPTRCHKAIAVTGGIAVSAAVSVPGTIANRIALQAGRISQGQCLCDVCIEHPSGVMELRVEHRDGNAHELAQVSLVRTARKIMSGTLFYALPQRKVAPLPSGPVVDIALGS
ncbi:4-oxalomesaconate tautomerase [Halomonas binhaiensis]|uniref:4-oxalomesaconate tautomerase n=1 Tax=Halomonas binhaiensis TaxID=2562282 RepID=A0A5C1NKX6_9GAMM|nr:4-oxalomesaconate tautomerase [Halomonas binhaiensis]QEM83047.1 4-oxalomesaconate tautomerase [Halomonas binhaiensis]